MWKFWRGIPKQSSCTPYYFTIERKLPKFKTKILFFGRETSFQKSLGVISFSRKLSKYSFQDNKLAIFKYELREECQTAFKIFIMYYAITFSKPMSIRYVDEFLLGILSQLRFFALFMQTGTITYLFYPCRASWIHNIHFHYTIKLYSWIFQWFHFTFCIRNCL